MAAVIDARRSPRMRTSTDAVVRVGRCTMPAVIRSVSTTGMGIELEGEQRGLLRGGSMRVSFRLCGALVELPGKIVWRGGAEDAS